MWSALAAYLLLREHSGAFGISNAPPFYRFSTDPAVIGKNFIEYADRSMTLGVLMIAAAIAALGRLPVFTSEDKRVMLKGAAWLVCGFALTLWLPVRSSLYVVFPSVGFAIVTATMVSAIAARATAARALRVARAPFRRTPAAVD